MKVQLLNETKMMKNKDFFLLSNSVVFFMLINVKNTNKLFHDNLHARLS